MGPLPAAVGGGGGRCAAFGAPKTAGSARVSSRECRNRAPMRAVAHRAAVTTRTRTSRGTPDVRLVDTGWRRMNGARSSPIAPRRRPGHNGQAQTAAFYFVCAVGYKSLTGRADPRVGPGRNHMGPPLLIPVSGCVDVRSTGLQAGPGPPLATLK